MTNQELLDLIQKAVITTQALATNGKLNPAQSKQFIDYVVEETQLTQLARVVRFTNESLEIDKITVGNRVTVPAAEATDPGVRRGVSTSKITLTPAEQMTPFEIGDTFKEINIEGEDVEDHIVRMMAKATGNDLEELYINGATEGAAALESDLKANGSSTQYIKDTFLAQFNGWSKLADSGHVVDAGGASIGVSIFGAMFRALPTKFKRNKNDLRWYGSPDLLQLYEEKLATRATARGDAAVEGAWAVKPNGILYVPVPLWDFEPTVVEHLAFTGDGTTVTLANANATNVVVHLSSLSDTPTSAYVEDTDYTFDSATGVITHIPSGSGGSIGNTATIKVTYSAPPQLLLTHKNNLILGIGRDVRIERDRDIYRRANQFAITTKVACQLEETDIMVKCKNIGRSL